MLRKLLCWLGWHEWDWICTIEYCKVGLIYEVDCFKCPFYKKICKHCGKVKQ